MKYLYILLLGLIIYYIISRFYEKYTENFDPSLVPVSSIVTLAKVAQKLVDGGGTLTNPGNLQIGMPGTGTTGNLIVTGNSIVDGTATVKGNTVLNGSVNVGPKTGSGHIFDGNGKTRFSWMVNDNTIVNALPGKAVEFNDSGGIPSGVNINMNGTLTSPKANITGNLTVGTTDTPAKTNSLTVNGQTTIFGNLSTATKGPGLAAMSLYTPGTGYTFYAADPAYKDGGGLSANHLQLFSYGAGAPNDGYINQLIDMYPQYPAGNNYPAKKTNTINLFADTTVANNLTVGGDLTVSGKFNIVPKGSIMMWIGSNIPAGWALCDGKTIGDVKLPDMRGRFIFGGSGSNSNTTSVHDPHTGDYYKCGAREVCHETRTIPGFVVNFIMKL